VNTPSETSAKTLRCAVIGVGRMGRHHARVYAQTPGVRLVGVVDDDEGRRESVAEARACKALPSVDALLAEGVDAVSIAVPTTHHLRIARPLLEAGVACLIEKPLAPDAEEAEEITRLAEASGAALQVGHIERYNPAVRALRSRQREGAGEIVPRFIEVHRVSPMTSRSVDVSVVFDMMIHDLDVVLMLMGGQEPVDVQAAGVAVVTEHNDVCNARLTFRRPQGVCVANITASRLAFKTERKTRVIADDAYVSIDYAKRAGVLIRRTANQMQLEEVRAALREGKDLSDLNYHELVALEDLKVDDADQLELQIADFLDAVRTGRRPDVDARAGFAAVRTAERIEQACRDARAGL
jgi:predicted dehydrogenase